jgi:hypothetical protein
MLADLKAMVAHCAACYLLHVWQARGLGRHREWYDGGGCAKDELRSLSSETLDMRSA